ncbi:MAG: small acid-soluble spore protein O [Bacillus sp. (in: firmicutes)]
MKKKNANHVIPGMNAAGAQGNAAGYPKSDEPLTAMERAHNKKRKKNQ